MKRYLRIIKNNILSVFSIIALCFIIIIFAYTFLVKFNSFDDINTFSEVINKIFCGPNSLRNNIIDVFTWSLYQFFIIYIIGNYFFKELNTRGIYTIMRLGSKKYWHISLQITCFLACIIYFVFAFFIIFIYKLP